MFYYGTTLAQMGPVGCPRPTPQTIFQVRIDGQIYRVRRERALDWANYLAERRIRAAEAEERRRPLIRASGRLGVCLFAFPLFFPI